MDERRAGTKMHPLKCSLNLDTHLDQIEDPNLVFLEVGKEEEKEGGAVARSAERVEGTPVVTGGCTYGDGGMANRDSVS